MGRRKILLWNRYGDQMHLAWSRKHTLSEILDILAYIQRMNYEACPSYELSDFRELYQTQSVPEETIKNNEIAETIEAMVRENPNAQPWLL